ncbi:MAG: hypothetical protein JXR03_18430 [Cyclobacteriaceae bacterium]
MSNSLERVFDEEVFGEFPDREFERIQSNETDLLLDFLGYYKQIVPDNNERKSAIKRFRNDCTHLPIDLRERLMGLPIEKNEKFLLSQELAFLDFVTSYEGEFALHKYSDLEIRESIFLIRCFRFRFAALRLINDQALKKLDQIISTYSANRKEVKTIQKIFAESIGKLMFWSNARTKEHAIWLSGNLSELLKRALSNKALLGKGYFGLLILHNRIDTDDEKKFDGDLVRFKTKFTKPQAYHFKFFRKEKKQIGISKRGGKPKEVWIEESKIRSKADSEINQFLKKVIQLRLWDLGLYPGRPDNQFGKKSFQSIKHLLELYSFNEGKHRGIKKKLLIHNINDDLWLLNPILLNSMLDELQEEQENTHSAEKLSISGQLSDYVSQVKSQKDQNILLEQIESEIDSKVSHPNCSKKVSKGFFRSIRNFFRKAKKFVVGIINKVKDLIKSFFKWIKNAVDILLKEIKAIFRKIKEALTFLFGKRYFSSSKVQKGSVSSDYGFDFDNITMIRNASNEVILEHINLNNRKVKSFEEVLGFLGLTLNIAINAFKGPVGWIQLGIDLIKAISSRVRMST